MSIVFISYRHQDADHAAARMFERLETALGQGVVFRDVDGTSLGEDFPVRIKNEIDACHVFLVIISQGWLGEVNRSGPPKNWLRFEVEKALERSADAGQDAMKIIPVVLEPVKMPTPSDLPDSISTLADRHGITISSGTQFQKSYEQLLDGIIPALPAPMRRKFAGRSQTTRKTNRSPILTILTFLTLTALFCTTLAYVWTSGQSTEIRSVSLRNQILAEDLERVADRLRSSPVEPLRESKIPTEIVATLGSPNLSTFEVRSDERVWDIRAFKPEMVPDAKESFVSASVYHRTIHMLKIEECQELRFQHKTGGTKIVFGANEDVLVKHSVRAEASAQNSTVGENRMHTADLCFDVSAIPVGRSFFLSYQATYWDSPESSGRWFGSVGYPECQSLKMIVVSDISECFANLLLKTSFTHRSEITSCQDGAAVLTEAKDAFLWEILKPTPHQVYMAYF